MKRAILLSLLILPILSARPNDDWREEDRESIHKTFKVAAGENVAKLISDQVDGPSHHRWERHRDPDRHRETHPRRNAV